ncbi:hypothetical protein Daura_06290 [Dactylosporangium aurantiacum]|uniref:Uncharacterized protein n=1 Tax=Dactylosporangium aurantiacum TaxID=35754 RepID=A0A9Q9IL24_9ACTN|nr:hypothetical protein [Dactylosporangium aurantiacum]MDG6108784.1 hypothetical protein [Dactylosporangium aurantiacum]UWZ55807.1 hypothetical protein Daura_06290 [Dactylosporangium aurantiacum]
MTAPQWFHFGPWTFSIDAADALIAARPRGIQRIDVATWAEAYGLTHLDEHDRRGVSLIGPASDSFNRAYAMTTDLAEPVIVATIALNGQTPVPLLIDGTHRLYRAWREGVAELPAYLLTVDETRQVQHHALLGPGRTRITPPPH